MDFLKKTSQVLSSSFLGLSLDLVTNILIVRSLGAHDYGVYTIAFLIPGVIVSLGSFGLGPSLIYHVNKEQIPLGRLVGFSVVFAGVVGGGCYLIFFFLNHVVETVFLNNKIPHGILLISMLYVPIMLTQKYTRSLLRATYRIKDFTLIVHLLPTVVRLVLIVMILHVLHIGLPGILWVPIVTESIVCAAVFWALKKDLNLRSLKTFALPQQSQMQRILGFACKNHVGSILQKSNDQIILLSLSWLLEPASVGYFSLASKLTKMLPAVTASVTTVLVPKVARSHFHEIRDYFPRLARMLLFFLVILGLLLGAILPVFVSIAYGQEFHVVTAISWILLPGMALLAIVRLTNTMFTQSGRPMVKSVIRGIGLIVNIVLLILLLPSFGITGGGIALTGSYGCMFLIAIGLAIRHLDLSIGTLILVKLSDIQEVKDVLVNILSRHLKPSMLTRS